MKPRTGASLATRARMRTSTVSRVHGRTWVTGPSLVVGERDLR